MKKVIKLLGIIALAMVLPVLVSCGDDDEELPLERVIVGKWYSYKAIVSSGGNKKTVTVTKDGEYAGFYLEFIAEQNGKGVLRGWKTDGNEGAMYWGEEENCTYTINGNEVTVMGQKSGKIIANYYPKDKIVIFTMISKDYLNNLITTNLYFKK